MERILLEDAINNNKRYYISNKENLRNSQLYYFLIDGNIRILKQDKRKLKINEENKELPDEYFENSILEVEIEYTNLNYFDNDIEIFIHNNCYLVDLEGYHFDIDNIKNDNGLGYFIPKIKQRIKLIFLVPDEDTKYLLEISNTIIKEEEN